MAGYEGIQPKIGLELSQAASVAWVFESGSGLQCQKRNSRHATGAVRVVRVQSAFQDFNESGQENHLISAEC